MKKLILSFVLATICFVGNSQTNQNALERGWQNVKGWTHVETALYSKGETILDISGTYTAAEPGGITKLFDNSFTRGKYGVDVGVTYFPSKYLGLGVDVVCTDLHRPSQLLIDELNLSTILRYPINRVAPYAIASIGRSFENGLYSFQAGPGVELRVNKNIGLFTDARFQWQMDSRRDTTLVRAGVRFIF